MDEKEVTFSLSYEELTQTAEEEIKKCWLEPGPIYLKELSRANGILGFWHRLALRGHLDAAAADRVETDWQRLKALL